MLSVCIRNAECVLCNVLHGCVMQETYLMLAWSCVSPVLLNNTRCKGQMLVKHVGHTHKAPSSQRPTTCCAGGRTSRTRASRTRCVLRRRARRGGARCRRRASPAGPMAGRLQASRATFPKAAVSELRPAVLWRCRRTGKQIVSCISLCYSEIGICCCSLCTCGLFAGESFPVHMIFETAH